MEIKTLIELSLMDFKTCYNNEEYNKRYVEAFDRLIDQNIIIGLWRAKYKDEEFYILLNKYRRYTIFNSFVLIDILDTISTHNYPWNFLIDKSNINIKDCIIFGSKEFTDEDEKNVKLINL